MNHPLALLIVLTAIARIAFAATIGLGVDESYMVAAGRVLSFGYFDHPPAAWWLSWGGAHLLGTEAPVAVRLPFILLFALTTWLIARLAQDLGGPRAGFWAALTLNLSPVFGVTSGGWVLPDGPLDCALAGAALYLSRAISVPANTTDEAAGAIGSWLGAGICAGLALFSKYSALLTIAGAFLFLLSDPAQRVWLRRVHPYAAAGLALAVFSPVIIWNASHDWVSFTFQGARAGGLSLHPLGPLITLGGEAVFVLPWIWLPLVILGSRAFRGEPRERLLAWLASGPIVVFAAVSAWSSQRILFHWAAPGYLMLFPLLGVWLARNEAHPGLRRAVKGTGALVLAAVVVIGLQERTDVLRVVMPAKDPTAEGIDWTSLSEDLVARHVLGPDSVIGVPNWRDAGKIAYGLGPGLPVVCLNADCRQFNLASPPANWFGRDFVLLSPDAGDRAIPALSDRFQELESLPPSAVTLNGRRVRVVNVAIGHGFRGWAPK